MEIRCNNEIEKMEMLKEEILLSALTTFLRL